MPVNCVWITTDSFRQDHVHCCRPEGTLDDTGASIRVQTPNLDRLAGESVMFRRMRAEALPTIPCRRGFFTGRRVFPWPQEPFYKGVYLRFPGWRPLPQEDVTVAEHLAERGYVAGIVADTYHIMKPSMNFHRGFHSFHWVRGQEFDRWLSQPLPEGCLARHLKGGLGVEANRSLVQYLKNHMYVSRDEDYPVARRFRWAVQWLERNNAHERFFLYLDTFDPHEPWLVPQGFLDLYDPGWDGPKLIYGNLYRRSQLTDAEHHHLRARYAAACTHVDHWIGELLRAIDRLGMRENTLVVLASDHGKIIGEFGHYGMPAQDTGPALSQVPCFIRHPGGRNAGKSFDGWLYNIDLTATVLDLLDVEPKPDVEGKSVWPAVTDGAEGFRDGLVTAYGDHVAAWEGDWLYLLNTASGDAALYDLEADIHRKRDVADRYPSVRDGLAARIAALAGRRGAEP